MAREMLYRELGSLKNVPRATPSYWRSAPASCDLALAGGLERRNSAAAGPAQRFARAAARHRPFVDATGQGSLANLAHLRRRPRLLTWDREYRAPARCRRARPRRADVDRALLAAVPRDVRETPYAYLMTRRIERAKALLRRGDLSVTEVCMAVGLPRSARSAPASPSWSARRRRPTGPATTARSRASRAASPRTSPDRAAGRAGSEKRGSAGSLGLLP